MTCQRRCAGEAQRRRYGRHTRLAAVYRYRIGFLGFCLCLFIVVHTVAAARRGPGTLGMERNIMTVLLFNLLIAVAATIAAPLCIGVRQRLSSPKSY
jgi:hypothetical protein